MARHEEVARILEQVEAHEVALQDRGEEFFAVLEHHEDATRGEGRVEEETDVRLARERGLPQIGRHHQQVVTMNPHLLHLRELLSKFIDFQSEYLIDLDIVLPQFLELIVCQVSQISLVEVLEVVKERFHDVLVEVIVRQQLVHRHEDGVAALVLKQLLYLALFLLGVLFHALQDADPLEILLLFVEQLEERAVEDGVLRDRQLYLEGVFVFGVPRHCVRQKEARDALGLIRVDGVRIHGSLYRAAHTTILVR